MREQEDCLYNYKEFAQAVKAYVGVKLQVTTRGRNNMAIAEGVQLRSVRVRTPMRCGWEVLG